MHDRRAFVVVGVTAEAVAADSAPERALAVELDRLDGVRDRMQHLTALERPAAGALRRVAVRETPPHAPLPGEVP